MFFCDLKSFKKEWNKNARTEKLVKSKESIARYKKKTRQQSDTNIDKHAHMYTYIHHIDIYVYIPTDACLLPAHKGDVCINPLDMLDICIYTYVHVSITKV